MNEENGDPCGPAPGIDTENDVPYTAEPVKGKTADLVIPKNVRGPLPVLIYFNGSLFSGSSKAVSRPLCTLMARRGFFVVNAEFRNIARGVSVGDTISDAVDICTWIKSNAEKYNLDINKVCSAGSSNGAMMSVWLSMICNGNRLSEVLDIPSPGFEIKALGLLCGITDSSSKKGPLKAITRLGLRSKTELAEVLSPYSNHDLDVMPPVFQAVSSHDPSFDQAKKFRDLMDTNGIDNRLMIFDSDRLPHDFVEKSPKLQESVRALSAMSAFLRSHQ